MSFIFSKKFVAFNVHEHDRRKTDLLTTLGLSQRIYHQDMRIAEDVDYDKVGEMIEKERNKTIQYFQDILSNC